MLKILVDNNIIEIAANYQVGVHSRNYSYTEEFIRLFNDSVTDEIIEVKLRYDKRGYIPTEQPMLDQYNLMLSDRFKIDSYGKNVFIINNIYFCL